MEKYFITGSDTFKSSQEWYDELYPEKEVIVIDPDGWDRRNFQYSWYVETITYTTFLSRLMISTCVIKK